MAYWENSNSSSGSKTENINLESVIPNYIWTKILLIWFCKYEQRHSHFFWTWSERELFIAYIVYVYILAVDNNIGFILKSVILYQYR